MIEIILSIFVFFGMLTIITMAVGLPLSDWLRQRRLRVKQSSPTLPFIHCSPYPVAPFGGGGGAGVGIGGQPIGLDIYNVPIYGAGGQGSDISLLKTVTDLCARIEMQDKQIETYRKKAKNV